MLFYKYRQLNKLKNWNSCRLLIASPLCVLDIWKCISYCLFLSSIWQSTQQHRITTGRTKTANASQTCRSENMSNTSQPETISIINCALNAPLMLISIIGNTLVLSAIWRTSALRSPSIILVCSLAASDLTVGFVVQPLYITSTITANSVLFQATLNWCVAPYHDSYKRG